MRFPHSQIKRSSTAFDVSQGPLIFGPEARKRFSSSDGNTPIWLPQTSRDFLRAHQAATIENHKEMDPGLLAAMLDRNTLEMTSGNSPLVQRPMTVAEQRGKGLTAGTVLGSALQLVAKKDASKITRALLGLAGLGVGLGLSSGPRHPLGKSAVVDWETDPEKPNFVQVPKRASLSRALGDAIVGGIGGGTVAMLSGAKKPMIGAGIGIGAAGLAALNQALAARGDRIYSGVSKKSSVKNVEPYDENIEPYDYDSEQSRARAQMSGGAILAHLALGLGWLGSGISERKIENQRLNQRLLNPSRSFEEFDAARLLTRKLIDNSNRNWAIAAGLGAIPGLAIFGSGLHRVIKDERLRNSKTSSDNSIGLVYKNVLSARLLESNGKIQIASKHSSVPDMEEYFYKQLKNRQDYLTLRDKQHKNTAALGLLGAVPGAALSGLGTHTMMRNLTSNPSWSKGALGFVGALAGGALAALPSKLMQQADARRRQETGVDPGFVAPEITAHRTLADAAAGVGLGTGLAMTINQPALAAAAAGVAGLTGILAVSRAMKRDREQADLVASNDKSAYAAGRGLAEGNRFVRNLSPGMMYVSPVAPGERVLGSG